MLESTGMKTMSWWVVTAQSSRWMNIRQLSNYSVCIDKTCFTFTPNMHTYSMLGVKLVFLRWRNGCQPEGVTY